MKTILKKLKHVSTADQLPALHKISGQKTTPSYLPPTFTSYDIHCNSKRIGRATSGFDHADAE